MKRKSGLSGILLGLAVLILLVPAAAYAQVQKGSLFVKAVDQQGGILPGATLELTSPVMPGAITATTDSGGQYRFVSLTPGTYSVKVSLQGMQTLIRQNLIVQQDQTVEVTLALKVGQQSESVTVQAETPVVDTKAATVATNIDQHLLQNTPGGEDIWSIIEYKAPGVTIDTGAGSPPDVGGNQGGLQRSLTSRGVPNGQNTQMLNGVNVNDPAAQGFSMNYYVPEALANIQVSTAADDISIGTAGVFINMVTKSGSNNYGGSFFGTCQGNCGVHTQGSNVNTAQQLDGIRAGSNGTNILTNTNFQIGGPLIHNRLFFFQSTNFQAIHVGVTSFPAVAPANILTPLSNTSQQDTTDTLAGEGKINFQLNSKNRFEGYLSKQRYDKPNRGSSFSNTQDSDWHELDTFVIMQASWNYVISPRAFLDTRASYNNTHFDLQEKTNLLTLSDTVTGNTYQNEGSQPFMFRRRTEVLSNFQYFLPNWLGGRHEFRLGFDNGNTPETVTTNRAQDATATINTNLPLATEGQQITIFNTPTIVNRAVNSTAFYGQETYSLNRLTAVAGLRWERVEGYLPPQTTTADSQFFPAGTVFNSVTLLGVTGPYTVQDQFAAVHSDPLWKNVAPRVSLTYDLTGKGKSALKFSAGRYLDQISTGTPPNPNGSISQTYNWNDVNGNLTFNPNNIVWNPSGTCGQTSKTPSLGCYTGPDLGSLVRTSIPAPAGFNQAELRPFTDEQTVEFDQELMPGLAATIAFVHTAQHHQLGSVDPNEANWFTGPNPEYIPVNLLDPGVNGVVTANSAPITAYALAPGQAVTTLTENDERLDEHTKSVSFDITKRFSHGWQLLGGYTYTGVTQAAASVSSPNALINAAGVPGGRAHDFKVAGSFQLPYQILFGVNARLDSGLPITRTWSIPGCSSSVTTNCVSSGGVSINAIPRGSVLLPWLGTADIRFGRFFNVGTNRFDLSFDIYNITNANTIFSVRTTTGLVTVFNNNVATNSSQVIPQWLSPTGVTAPRILRVNLTWSFGAR